MRFYCPIAKVDAAQRMVWGYASTEAVDDQGEIVSRAAMSDALDDYLQFANIREMHQPSAVGVAKEATMDGTGLYLGAKIIDEAAWQKVVEGVYKGFSIGGRVTARDPANRKNITGLRLTEISVVDRPANPEAVFDCWKLSEGGPLMPDGSEPFNAPLQIWACGDAAHRHIAKAEAVDCITKRGAGVAREVVEKLSEEAAADAPLDAAIVAGKAALALAEEALAKAGDAPGDGDKPYGDVEYADSGLQSDGKKRYPIDTEKHIRAAWSYINKPKNAKKYSAEDAAKVKAKIVSAWKEKIDKDGPPSADAEKAAQPDTLQKHLYDVGQVAQVILDLDWLKDALEIEAVMEGDDSEQPAKLQAIISELCAFLIALATEEAAEIIADEEDPGYGAPASVVANAALAGELRKIVGSEKLDRWLAKGAPAIDDAPDPIETELRKAGARNSRSDKARIQKMHDLTGELGADCNPDNVAEAAATGDLAKLEGQNADLTKMVGDLSGAVERMARRVEDIAKTPLPPLTMRTDGLTVITKSQDGADPAEVAVDVVAELAKMSEEDRTLAMIKASKRTPIPAPGLQR